jgi:hypothetical protein
MFIDIHNTKRNKSVLLTASFVCATAQREMAGPVLTNILMRMKTSRPRHKTHLHSHLRLLDYSFTSAAGDTAAQLADAMDCIQALKTELCITHQRLNTALQMNTALLALNEDPLQLHSQDEAEEQDELLTKAEKDDELHTEELEDALHGHQILDELQEDGFCMVDH